MKKISCMTVIVCMLSALWAGAHAFPLPDGTKLEDGFRPGLGESLGEVLLMQGSVFVIHEDQPDAAFSVMKGIPLFKGDTVITAEDGKVSMELTDGSLVTLTTRSNVVITEHLFAEKDAKERASFVSMNLGRARFFVRKLLGFDPSDFKVKTKTAIVGVRGSDFVVAAEETSTQVTALENTLLELVSLIAPCKRHEDMKQAQDCRVEPILLTDFRQAVITADGQILVTPGMLPMEQIERLRQEFIIRPDGEEFRKGGEEEGFGRGIRVSNDRLIPPERIKTIEYSSAEKPEIVPSAGDDVREDVSHDMPDREITHPDEIRELPGFPDSPE